jgi:hypothetical protein
MNASSSALLNGAGACGEVTRRTGAFRYRNPRSTHSAATSLAIPAARRRLVGDDHAAGLLERREDRVLVERRE